MEKQTSNRTPMDSLLELFCHIDGFWAASLGQLFAGAWVSEITHSLSSVQLSQLLPWACHDTPRSGQLLLTSSLQLS